MRVRATWPLLKEAFNEWSEDRAPRLGAALAYYTIFSIVPLLMVAIGLAGLVFGEEVARGEILRQISGLVGERSAATIQEMLQQARQPTTGIWGSVVGITMLLLGASGVFGQLQDALNSVWGVKAKPGAGIMGMLKDRFLSFVTVLGTAFLLLVSLLLSAGLAAVGKSLSGFLPAPESVLQALNFVISFAVITLLFAMIFKILPDVKLQWGDVWIGAAVTALLFTIGKSLIGLYLGKSDIGTVFGAAGSLVILLVWVYYSAQILLFGAEFTAVYTNRYGSRLEPAENAVPVTEEARAQQGMTAEKPIVARERSRRLREAPVRSSKDQYDETIAGVMQRHPTALFIGVAFGFVVSRLLKPAQGTQPKTRGTSPAPAAYQTIKNQPVVRH
jgi:membrane protein